MANTFTKSSFCLNISALNSDWLWSETWPGHDRGVPVWSIHFLAAAANDKCFIKDGSLTGPIVFHRLAVAIGDQVPSYFGGGLIRLALDFSDGTYNAASVVIITLDRTRM